MSLRAKSIGYLQVHRSATSILLWSQRSVPEGRRSMRFSGWFGFSLTARSSGFLSSAEPSVATQLRSALLATPFRFASALAQRLAASLVGRVAQASSRHPRPFSAVRVSRFVLQSHAEKTAPSSSQCSNPALNLAPFSRWTLRDKTAQRRLALR